MKKQQTLTAYLLIGIGVFFLLQQLNIPILSNFYSWQTIIILIGLVLLIHSYVTKSYQNLFTGTVILGLGIHFYGIAYYSFWIDHWAMYLLIVGIAFIIRYLHTKEGIIPGLLLIVFAIIMLFSIQLPVWFNWIYIVVEYLERFWPVILIVLGLYLLKRKK
ncbi:MAG: LiaI-LiaF-like domain-containing protein [Bacillota bacterium]|uniref:LiaI-LiaF-like transmembrane region domain-containing protein n=1 Tax=Virgibacillus salarius TaxID=447199 RepID=A0A941DZB6_9BACI|nr:MULTISPECIES: DUF5668 domain-containing protein [Bacillaceae]NAZ09643.1 hypothetical protein [Agaribacter marinus]MBR7796933.1 hypothetical protein [Virgibacillus salarius]MCC2252195.1 DUF5668 domain-containing protein [Virgibacillus sp. AGTR]MDY7046393.1 DUF5668 domain-containing protein [Virgibacillus sp. M23]QRZ17606.1 hypothetical protein JUJ52_17850 [Virgibacillus sp. AGTR]